MLLSPDFTAVIFSHPASGLALWKQAHAISALLTCPHTSAAHLSAHDGKGTGTAWQLHCVATRVHGHMSNTEFKHQGKGPLSLPQEKYLCLLQPKTLLHHSGDQPTHYFLYSCFITHKTRYPDLNCPSAQNSTGAFNPPGFPSLPFGASLDSGLSS